MILENLEFDGSTVLCRVCGDKASGFHYGVHACEGCKGFFRRSIQQKIQYRPCLKNQQCNIMRVNRNRCQYCRLKKCIAVGMSRDAVRFGRVPKKEKAKIMEQMKRVNAQSQMNALHTSLENDQEFLDKIIKAHYHNCDYTNEKVREMIDRAWLHPQFINCPAHMACPLNPKPDSPTTTEGSNDKWDDFTEYFTPAIRNVVNFAKNIPGFQTFSQEDQVNLLKAGTFEVLLVHLAPFFDAKHNTMMFANGRLFKRSSFNMSSNAGFLLDSMFDFSERMNGLSLNDEEIALFSAAVIVAADRPGLRNIDLVERVQRKIHQGLQMLVKINHRDDPSLFPKILMKIPDLRTLNTLHSEKLLGMTVAADGQPIAEVKQELDDEAKPAVNTREGGDDLARSKTCPFSSGKPASNEARYPPVLGHPFPLQFPFAPQMPFMRSQDYRSELLHNAFAMYGTGFPHHQQLPIFPQVKPELPGKAAPTGPKQWLEASKPAPLADFGTHVKDLYFDQKSDSEKFEEDKEDSNTSAPRSPILDVLHDDEEEDDIEGSIDVDINDDQELVTGHNPFLSGISEPTDSRISAAASPSRSAEGMEEQQPPLVIKPERHNPTRKRSMDMNKHEIRTKISKLQSEEYDIRSSRSNSISSHTSIDSTDSAYRTISSPGTPRSLANADVRSPLQTHSKSLLKDCLKSQLPDETKSLTDELLNGKAIDSKSGKTSPTLPVLKQALSIPPLVAQDSWFYSPKCKKTTSTEFSSSGSDYSSQTSSRSVSPDELKRSNRKQFKLKKALLERFSPSCQDEEPMQLMQEAETICDQSRNSSPLSLKSRLLHRAERDSDQQDNEENLSSNTQDEVLDLHVHKNPLKSTARSCPASATDLQNISLASHSASRNSERGGYSSFHSKYHDIGKSHSATLGSNHTVSSPSSQASGHMPCPLPPGYLTSMAFPPHQSQQPPVHPALLFQYSAMQQQFKTLQQLEAHRVLTSQLEQRSQPIADHALNLALKKEPV